MQKLASWEFLIPALAFFGTLHVHDDHAQLVPILGALLVLSGVVISESPLGAALWKKWNDRGGSQ